jgi:hypothetical protein
MVDAKMQIVVRYPTQPDITKLTIVKGLKDEEQLPKAVKRERRKNTANNKSMFKNWCMPDEQIGYIKCRKHDFL